MKEKWIEPTLVPLPEEEVKQLAIDITENRIWTSAFHGEQADDSFMVLKMWIGSVQSETDATSEQLLEHINKWGMIYEYMKEAGPMSVNGRPVFMSHRILPRENMESLISYLRKLEDAKENL